MDRYYEVWRSRNEGRNWSIITVGIRLNEEEANRYLEEEKRKHPSDWLKVVMIETSTVSQYLGNKKKGIGRK